MKLVILKRTTPVSHLRNSSFLHISNEQNITTTATGADYTLSAMVKQSNRLRNRTVVTTRRIGSGKQQRGRMTTKKNERHIMVESLSDPSIMAILHIPFLKKPQPLLSAPHLMPHLAVHTLYQSQAESCYSTLSSSKS
jgi:hypothetical protein